MSHGVDDLATDHRLKAAGLRAWRGARPAVPGAARHRRGGVQAQERPEKRRELLWYKKPPTASDPCHQNHLLDFDATWIR